MNEEHSNEVLLEKPVAEQTVTDCKFDGLSNREALAEAVKIHSEGRDEAPTNREVSQAVQADIEPPSEFSREGKEAWKRRDVGAIQKEYRRIHDARTAEITRAQQAERAARAEAERERSQVKPIRDLAEKVKNYLSVRGEADLPDEVKIAQALQLVSEMRKGDGAAVKAELRRLGIDLDGSASQPTAGLSKEDRERIDALQEVANEYKKDKESQQFQRTVQTFDSIFETLTAQKTRTGETVFPDLLDNSEKGIQFARELGSLTQDARFQAGVLRRFPDADLSTVVREAYKYLGGRVSGEPVKVSTQANNQHLQRSRRASAASPGRTAPRVNDSNLQGKLSNRAALKKALEIHRGQ
jgi:hypothetical protein